MSRCKEFQIKDWRIKRLEQDRQLREIMHYWKPRVRGRTSPLSYLQIKQGKQMPE